LWRSRSGSENLGEPVNMFFGFPELSVCPSQRCTIGRGTPHAGRGGDLGIGFHGAGPLGIATSAMLRDTFRLKVRTSPWACCIRDLCCIRRWQHGGYICISPSTAAGNWSSISARRSVGLQWCRHVSPCSAPFKIPPLVDWLSSSLPSWRKPEPKPVGMIVPVAPDVPLGGRRPKTAAPLANPRAQN
jgi:hypothetical protein